MLKTPEDVRRALKFCSLESCNCMDCPYNPYGLPEECMTLLIRDATELLDELEAQSPRWISTDVEMPEVDQPVFVHVVHRASPDDGWWVIESDIWCGDGWDVNADDGMHWVTHWKRVGERPEEFRNAENKA